MLRRISTVVAVVAVGSTTLVAAPAAASALGAPKAPDITRVVVHPNPVVVPGKEKVTVTFTFETGNNATAAEAYIKPPAPSVETKIELTKRNLGFGKTRWIGKTQFDRGAKAGTWNLRVAAKNSGGEDAETKRFEVRQVWETAFRDFDARPRAVRKGDSVRLDGELRVNSEKGWRPLGGEKVYIAFKPVGGRSWQRVDVTRTRRDGEFSDRVRATRSGWYRAEYDGSKTTHAAKSGADRVTVKPRELDTRIARFDASPRSVKKGEKITAAGVLQVKEGRRWDGLRGKRVDILFLAKGAKKWERVGSDRTDLRGRFDEKITATASGWYRAVFAGGPGLKDTASRRDWVTVTEPKADTRIRRFDAYPEPVRFGRHLNFRGSLEVLDGGKWVPFDRQKVRLFFRPSGERKWEPVKTAWTGRDGRFHLKVKAYKSGWWRVVFAGDDKTEEAVARPDHVRVVRR
jgi:hypothetical protein